MIICLFTICTSLPAFAETFDVGQQNLSPDESQQQEKFQETGSLVKSPNLSKNSGEFDPLNETLPGEAGEEEEASSMVGPGSILPGENVEQFTEDDMEPHEREGFLRSLPRGLN